MDGSDRAQLALRSRFPVTLAFGCFAPSQGELFIVDCLER